MKRLIQLTIVAGLLSACVSAEERREARLKSDQETCTAYGLKVGTAAFADCMLRLGDRRALEDMMISQNSARIGAQLLNGTPAF